MPDPAAFRTLALSCEGTTEVLHFDRRAFRRRVIFATLAPDGTSANLRLTPDQQAHWCSLLPHALCHVPNAWGARGWTTLDLARLDTAQTGILLRLAWQGAGGKRP